MPDLQTALSSVAKQIHFDDIDDTSTTYAAPTPSKALPVSQQLFYWYVNNPSSTPREAQEALDSGDTASISSRTNQMWKKGLLIRVHAGGAYRYTATTTTYPVFTVEMRQKQMAKAIAAKAEKRKSHKVAKVAKQKMIKASSDIATPPQNANPDAAKIVNNMSVGLAKAVYLELKKVFEA
jgi:hypothetical protein